MDDLLRELRHAVRRLLRTPAFTAAAVFTLAIAIGANTATFALVHRVVLSPLPYPDADRLIALDHGAPGIGLPSGIGMTDGLYREYAKLPSIERIGMYSTGEVTLSREGASAERFEAFNSTPSMGAILGAQPALGRWFSEADGEIGGSRVVILSHGLWTGRFGASPGVVGSSVYLDGNLHEIIGVMPRDFAFPDDHPRIILPLRLNPADARPGSFNYLGVALLRAGTTLEQAVAHQEVVIADLTARFPDHVAEAQAVTGDAQLGALPRPLRDAVLGDAVQTLWVLLGAAAIVLLIACANLANLFLVRAESRQREVAVRRAMGAGRHRIVGYFLAETMVVALVSGALGLMIGYMAVQLIVTRGVVELPRLHEVRIDAMVIGFTLLAAIVTGAIFGSMPLLKRLPAVSAVLQDSGRGNTASGSRMRARQGLMAAQVALAVILLVAAGLMMQSFQQLRSVDPGFAARDQLVFRIGLSASDYESNESAAQFHELLMDRIGGLPGVQSVAITTVLPLGGDGWGDVTPLDVFARPIGSGEMNAVVQLRRVSTDYFPAISIPLRQGRLLEAGDVSGATNAVVIDEAMADIYFPGEDPIGQRVRPIAMEDGGGWFTVVGVVGTTVTEDLRESAPLPNMYLPLRSAGDTISASLRSVAYIVQAVASPLALVPAVRRALDELDPHVAMARPERFGDLLTRARASHAFTMILMVIAAGVALLLGLVGVYAVISYGVAQRRGEIGVRLAMGASPAAVTGMIVRQSGRVIGVGVLLGVAGAIAATRLLQALLFGVAPNDVVTFVAVSVGLFAVALLASWIPAQRASRLDPLAALRE